MTSPLEDREMRRLAIQAELDGSKDQSERNRMGQFATPTELALEIVRYAKVQLNEASSIRFIDPALGTGSFYSALRRVFAEHRLETAVGFEIDPHYGKPASDLWDGSNLEIHLEDFTAACPPPEGEKFNLLICNPPYVRHHHIRGEEKKRLKAKTLQACGIKLNGLSGFYCYFLGLSHEWMASDGIAGWLIPSEFMDVNYGAAVKRYLLDQVTLLHIHRFDPNDVQFGDALVSSTVVWLINRKPPLDHRVRMTFGGSLLSPKLERVVPSDTLRNDPKWTQYPMKESNPAPCFPVLADFFTIKRGLATGNNGYFILSEDDVEERGLPTEALTPILPSPRYLPTGEVLADECGNPVMERRLFLLDCRLTEKHVKEKFPRLWSYFEEGKAKGVADRYICRNRSPWYTQESRPATPFLCTYLGRSDNKNGRPFRFILNHSRATAPNVYLMLYPKAAVESAIAAVPHLKHEIWELLNTIGSKEMLGEGRVYGGGLHKLEPKELGRVPVPTLAELLSAPTGTEWHQPSLFATTTS